MTAHADLNSLDSSASTAQSVAASQAHALDAQPAGCTDTHAHTDHHHSHDHAHDRGERPRNPSESGLAKAMRAEFPDLEKAVKGFSRRRFLQLMGASMSLAGLSLSGCRRWPEEQIVPFAHRPEGFAPGESQYYASIFERGGVSAGTLVKSVDGRPIKVEGNPLHPASLGATDVWAQATILQMYDPDRSRAPIQGKGRDNTHGKAATWETFAKVAAKHFKGLAGAGSNRLAVLAQPSDSPSRAAMRQQLAKAYPNAAWYEWEPVNRDAEIAGAKLAFGKALRPQYHLDRARVVACFDADPLLTHPASVRLARDWSQRRGKLADAKREMSRVYAAYPTFNVTGMMADERLPVRASKIPTLVRAVAERLGVGSGDASESLNGSTQWVEKLVKDLKAARGQSVVMAGPGQPAEVHALIWAINEALGNLGKTIELTEEPTGDRTQLDQIAELTKRMDSGEIDTLVILGGNPVYDAPADLQFAKALGNVKTSIHLGLYDNETAGQCDWHLPQAVALESWGDGRAWDGTVAVQQPLILPLFEGRSELELLAILTDQEADGYQIVRRTLLGQLEASKAKDYVGLDGEKRWRRLLNDGILPGSAYPTVQAKVNAQQVAQAAAAKLPAFEKAAAGTFELVLRPDNRILDGRWANNGWLQETPDPLSKSTWDNVALLALGDAKKLGIGEGDIVKLTVDGRSVELPAYLMPGQALGTVVTTLGFGRTRSGDTGNGVGGDTYQVRTSDAPHVAAVSISKTGEYRELAKTARYDHLGHVGDWAMNARIGEKGESGILIKDGSLAEYRENPNVAHEEPTGVLHLQLYTPPNDFNTPHAWGMAIDMTACTSCNACVVACQAENNVPVVGREQVVLSRQMQWLRIDRYFKGDLEKDPDVVHQPMMCVHCENAPCEEVCPVAATTHDTEGLNVMAYNRCIGTRYCSNNCPYKVRRFNFMDFHARQYPSWTPKPWLNMPDLEQVEEVGPIESLMFNPDVTVRMRGVMEKCTYCIQRIKEAEIKAENQFTKGERKQPLVADGELVTACQQACPTQAIVFGNLNDQNSRVSRLHKNPRSYKVLDDEFNTRPRTRHLMVLRNPVSGESESEA